VAGTTDERISSSIKKCGDLKQAGREIGKAFMWWVSRNSRRRMQLLVRIFVGCP
jgi:hypothetical protein